MIFTSVSRLGDFLLTLPVVSWHYKKTGEKGHLVLSDNFPTYKKVETLLRLQECVGQISYVNVGTDAFNDWKFNPADFNIKGEYANFGLYPYIKIEDYYLPDLYAEYNKLGVDYDFVLNIGDTSSAIGDKDYTVWIEASPWRSERGKLRSIVPKDCIELKSEYINDAIFAKHAKAVHTTMGGFGILLDLCRVPCNVYAEPWLIKWSNVYYKMKHNYIAL